MKLVLGTNHLGLGGSESYLITVAEQLDRLGHEVVLYASETGEGVAVALERGLTLVDEAELPEDCDAALVQDGAVSYQLAELLPSLPQLFVAHSESFDLQAPPQLEGIVGAIVALNDRVAARLRSYALEVDVVRLHQPIDTERFMPRSALPRVARRALLFSNTPHTDRLGMLEWACAEVGLELVRLGTLSGQTRDPRPALASAEIVIGYGRSILEAMACGRAAFVYDWNGGEGWMTPDAYPAIEADGIAGRSGRVILDADGLAEGLRGYDPSMGPANHDLVMAHHRANVHAQELVEQFRRLSAPAPRPRSPLQEMARLVRLEWRARGDVHSLQQENAMLRRLLGESEQSAREAREHAARTEARVRHSYEASVSWRFTAPLRAVKRAIRRLLRI
ncbi:MAG: hypothetical protein WD810_07850 [Solirubrobacterales bacterium]